MLRQALDALAGDAQPDATLREPDRGRVFACRSGMQTKMRLAKPVADAPKQKTRQSCCRAESLQECLSSVYQVDARDQEAKQGDRNAEILK